jgi:hypothetical protein
MWKKDGQEEQEEAKVHAMITVMQTQDTIVVSPEAEGWTGGWWLVAR